MKRINELLESKKNAFYNKGITDKNFISMIKQNNEEMRLIDLKINNMKIMKKRSVSVIPGRVRNGMVEGKKSESERGGHGSNHDVSTVSGGNANYKENLPKIEYIPKKIQS
jgi:hypothetical protein